MKKIQKRKGKFLLGSAQEVSGRSGGAILYVLLGRLGIPTHLNPLPPRPRWRTA